VEDIKAKEKVVLEVKSGSAVDDQPAE